MIRGRLIELKDQYYAVLNLKHEDGSRWQKRICLEIPVKNNKRRAEGKLMELTTEYTRQQQIQNDSPQIMFSDFIYKWLDNKVTTISPTTYRGYLHMIDKNLAPYFDGKRLRDIKYGDVEVYYAILSEKGLSGTTIQHHHMILQQVFHEACRKEIIEKNPMLLVEKPKRQKPNISYYSIEEAKKLWQAITGHKLEVVVKLTLLYGFRRSEVLGLRWSDIDFDAGTISVNQAIINGMSDGKMVVQEKAELKGKACHRTMPINDVICALLKQEYEAKKHFKSKYVCTDSRGVLINPDEVTSAFNKFLKKNELRHIRFHDLRHTTASLLIAARVPLIEVQHWLGHSTMLTTADLYSHLEYTMKMASSDAMKKF